MASGGNYVGFPTSEKIYPPIPGRATRFLSCMRSWYNVFFFLRKKPSSIVLSVSKHRKVEMVDDGFGELRNEFVLLLVKTCDLAITYM